MAYYTLLKSWYNNREAIIILDFDPFALRLCRKPQKTAHYTISLPLHGIIFSRGIKRIVTTGVVANEHFSN